METGNRPGAWVEYIQGCLAQAAESIAVKLLQATAGNVDSALKILDGTGAADDMRATICEALNAVWYSDWSE